MEVYLHSKDDLKKNVYKYIITLIPLYIYAIYKNGFLLYQKQMISFFAMFKIIYLLFIGIVCYILVCLILKKKLKLDLDFLSLFIIPLFMPPGINLLVYAISIFFSLLFVNIISKYFNFNHIAFIKLIIILCLVIMHKYSYHNNLELLNIYAFNTGDLLMGRNIGGIGSTSIILGIIIMIILSLTNNYKILISLSGLIGFFLSTYLLGDPLINSSSILSIILVSTDSKSSPTQNKYMIIYGLLIGILGSIFNHFNLFYEGMFISILGVSVIFEIITKIQTRRECLK